jgi:hypothetical protein
MSRRGGVAVGSLGLPIGAIMLLAAALLAAPASGKPAAPGYKLRLVEAEVLGSPYVFAAEGAVFPSRDRVKNIGKGPAPRSRTRLYLLSPSGREIPAGRRSVPALKPSESHGGRGAGLVRAIALAVRAQCIDQVGEGIVIEGHRFAVGATW